MKKIEKYFPGDFLSDRLYKRIFSDIVQESEDWGVLHIDNKPAWVWIRLREAEDLARLLMQVNVSKSLSMPVIRFKNGNTLELEVDEVILASSDEMPNPFYELFEKGE